MSDTGASRALISVRELSWHAGGKQILKPMSFEVQAGQFVGLIGPNGAGKSSLMRCLYRVNRPSSGVVQFDGKDVWTLSAREHAKNAAVILQESATNLGLTVAEIVILGLTPHKALFEGDSEADRAQLQTVLQQVDLWHFRERLFDHLSGGEKQRVMLARAILQRPRCLIMDEPTNHLDVHYQIDLLKQVKALNLTVIASFHDLNLAAAFCDEIKVLDGGELVASGSPEQVLTEDLISNTFNTCALVDRHPIGGHPRISYAYQ